MSRRLADRRTLSYALGYLGQIDEREGHLGEALRRSREALFLAQQASALLARELKADVFLMLTDVDAVYADWGEPHARAIRRISAQAMRGYSFAAGSMGPKVQAGIEYVEATDGIAGIGRLEDAQAILQGQAGTVIAGVSA